MTFEEFKKNFDPLNKINTPEKLAFAQQQHEIHLQYLEDSNYFEPFEFRDEEDISSVYNKRLLDIFQFRSILENQFFFLIKPSFTQEQLVVLTHSDGKYLLKHMELSQNFWCIFYANRNATSIDSKTIEILLPDLLGSNLFLLLNNAIINARVPEAGGFVLDGVVYQISKLFNGKLVTVSKHSPGPTSRTGKIIEVVELLISQISNLNDTSLSEINLKIEALL
jgi:hypothetical protein